MGSSNTGGGKDDSGKAGGSDSSNVGLQDPNSNPYSEAEKVLAYHGPRIYEAKIQKAELRKKEWRYFVHYLGWNKNWDEWVGMERLLKYTDENIQKQQALEKKLGSDKHHKSGRSTQTKQKGSIAAKGKKRKGDEKESASAEKFVKIQMPLTLKKQLVDDWELVTQKDKLVKLPRSPSVDDVLKKYLEYRTRKDGTFELIRASTSHLESSIEQVELELELLSSISTSGGQFLFSNMLRMTDSISEILNGLRCYFDKALPLMLLYKKERQQYREALPNNASPSTVYGAEHLLRLFVKLPELLAYVNMEEETMTRLQQKLVDFLRFLQKNQSTFFLSIYDGSRVAEGTAKDKEN